MSSTVHIPPQFEIVDRPLDTQMTISMGPQHPSTHGVLRLELVLDGEMVVKATPDIGYLHTGMDDGAINKDPNDPDAIKGAFKLHDDAKLEFEYKLGDRSVQLGGQVYDLNHGAVFLCDSLKEIRQLPVSLRSNVRLLTESVELSRTDRDIKRFVESAK